MCRKNNDKMLLDVFPTERFLKCLSWKGKTAKGIKEMVSNYPTPTTGEAVASRNRNPLPAWGARPMVEQ